MCPIPQAPLTYGRFGSDAASWPVRLHPELLLKVGPRGAGLGRWHPRRPRCLLVTVSASRVPGLLGPWSWGPGSWCLFLSKQVALPVGVGPGLNELPAVAAVGPGGSDAGIPSSTPPGPRLVAWKALAESDTFPERKTFLVFFQ